MPRLSLDQKHAIRDIVSPERARFDPRECRLYSHDTGVLPKLVRPLAGGRLADGVAQPETEEQVVELVKLAAVQRIPLVPRGKGTSGYGGAVPSHGGLVVDLTRLKGIVSINPERQTVTARAGTVWKDLEAQLQLHGLALRLYPTSAPGSTVGGWLAQGGAGIGSHQYGWFRENVVTARVVGGDGTVRALSGDTLAGIADAEGTTGIITEITLRVRPDNKQEQMAVAFPDADSLTMGLRALIGFGLPIWSITFLNPTMARLKNAGPPKTHHGQVLHMPAAMLPEDACTVMLAFDARHRDLVRSEGLALARRHGGRPLLPLIAHHEWEERFKPMRLKRLGPSVVPAEIVVPLTALADTLRDLDRKIGAPLAIEGFSVHGNEVVLLGFIPHDERTAAYTFGYGFALSALAVAEQHGGRGYSTGRYFGAKADKILGPDLVAGLKRYKEEVDPAGILNPGKVWGDGVLGKAINAASTLEPVVRTAANLFGKPGQPVELKAPAKGFPADVATYAYQCAQCGYCVDTCTLYQGRGWESSSPRGKWSFLKEVLEGRDKFDQDMVDTFLLCTTCEKCDIACQLDLPIEPTWGLLRGELVQERGFGTFPPFEIMGAALKGQRNIWGGLAEQRGAWLTDDVKANIKDQAKIGYFAGCTASFVEPDIAQATTKLLNAAGIDFTYLGKDEMCCGIPMLVAGKWDLWEEALRHNVAAMKSKGVEQVVTSCPACWLAWSTYYPQWADKLGIDYTFTARHYSQLLADKIADGTLTLPQLPQTFAGRDPAQGPAKVTFHDSCHIGRAGGVYEPPRDLIKAIPGVEYVEMEHHHEAALCCGSVLTRIGEPEPTSNRLGTIRVHEAEASGAEALLALCPCCQFQLRVSADTMDSKLPVIDLARISAEALGVNDLPDPNPEVLYQWAMFEKFINLMTVDGMVDAMGALTPQLLDAMPLGMGRMMRAIGHAPVLIREPMFKAMAPIMPLLFPKLLPSMMPKVLPHLIALVERTIDMPEYLRRQLPELFPEVVDNVLPKMLPDITPKFVPLLFEHLRH